MAPGSLLFKVLNRRWKAMIIPNCLVKKRSIKELNYFTTVISESQNYEVTFCLLVYFPVFKAENEHRPYWE
jgi:hypothetical protein